MGRIGFLGGLPLHAVLLWWSRVLWCMYVGDGLGRGMGVTDDDDDDDVMIGCFTADGML